MSKSKGHKKSQRSARNKRKRKFEIQRVRTEANKRCRREKHAELYPNNKV